MKRARDLRVALGGKIAAGDGDEALSAWLAGRDAVDVVGDCVLDLEAPLRAQFLAAWQAPWDLVIVANCEHPSLADIMEWVGDDDNVILLASPRGPTPPAVLCLEAPTP